MTTKRNDLNTTWREELAEAGVTEWEAVAPNEEALDVEFYPGFGGSEGPEILVWTKDRVYFPVVYDGSEWLGSAPRNPTKEGQKHVGGE
jgi:hypothetical protein